MAAIKRVSSMLKSNAYAGEWNGQNKVSENWVKIVQNTLTTIHAVTMGHCRFSNKNEQLECYKLLFLLNTVKSEDNEKRMASYNCNKTKIFSES